MGGRLGGAERSERPGGRLRQSKVANPTALGRGHCCSELLLLLHLCCCCCCLTVKCWIAAEKKKTPEISR